MNEVRSIGLHKIQGGVGTHVGVRGQAPVLHVTSVITQTCDCRQVVCEQDGARSCTQVGENVPLLQTLTSQCNPRGQDNTHVGRVLPKTAKNKNLQATFLMK
jgi:hypothetical protein